ncbi:MAG: hypothetical protein ABJB69_07935 [Spartobacteria bacterium]
MKTMRATARPVATIAILTLRGIGLEGARFGWANGLGGVGVGVLVGAVVVFADESSALLCCASALPVNAHKIDNNKIGLTKTFMARR